MILIQNLYFCAIILFTKLRKKHKFETTLIWKFLESWRGEREITSKIKFQAILKKMGRSGSSSGEKNKGNKSCLNVVISGVGGKKTKEWKACFLFFKVQHLNNPIKKILIWKRVFFWSWGQKMNVITPCVCYILLYILNTTWSYF